jgi:hypothetical protein
MCGHIFRRKERKRYERGRECAYELVEQCPRNHGDTSPRKTKTNVGGIGSRRSRDAAIHTSSTITT